MKYIPTPTKSEIRKYIIRKVRERPGVIFVDELNFIEQDLKKLEKLEKAIKIIKNKKVDVKLFIGIIVVLKENEKALEYYNCVNNKQLTQQEFDLLKEVFDNE